MKIINNLFILAAVAATLSSCSSEKNSRKEADPVSVDVYRPMQTSQQRFSVSGVLSSRQSAVLSTRMMAYVDQVLAKPGDKVRAGQVLVRLNASDLRAKHAQVKAQYTEAKAAAKNAERDYERFRKLHEQHSVSDKEFENMELNKVSMQSKVEMAQQGLREVEAMLAYTDIKAPFAGVVAQKMVEKGNMAQPGMPLMVIEQPGEMEARASVPENYVSDARVGDRVKVEVKSLGCTLDGTISELSSSAALTGGQYAMKVSIDMQGRKDLRSGMYVAISMDNAVAEELPSPSGIWIEKKSVVEREQLRGVYVAGSDDKAMLRWIRLGREDGSRVEVLSGLNEKERVISVPDGNLYNGRKVSVAK